MALTENKGLVRFPRMLYENTKVIDSLAASLLPGRADVPSGLPAGGSDVRQGVPGSSQDLDEGHSQLGCDEPGVGANRRSRRHANQQSLGQKRHVQSCTDYRGGRLGEDHGPDQRSDKADGRRQRARLRRVSPGLRALRTSVLPGEGGRSGPAAGLRPGRVLAGRAGRRWRLHVRAEPVVGPEARLSPRRGDSLRPLGRRRPGRVRRYRQGELLGRIHGHASTGAIARRRKVTRTVRR